MGARHNDCRRDRDLRFAVEPRAASRKKVLSALSPAIACNRAYSSGVNRTVMRGVWARGIKWAFENRKTRRSV